MEIRSCLNARTHGSESATFFFPSLSRVWNWRKETAQPPAVCSVQGASIRRHNFARQPLNCGRIAAHSRAVCTQHRITDPYLSSEPCCVCHNETLGQVRGCGRPSAQSAPGAIALDAWRRCAAFCAVPVPRWRQPARFAICRPLGERTQAGDGRPGFVDRIAPRANRAEEMVGNPERIEPPRAL